MERGLWCVVLLLLLPPGGASEMRIGDLCRTWTPQVKPPAGLFWCPGERDQPDAEFCCGTCSRPYCCSSEKEQLDQYQCRVELLNSTPSTAAIRHVWHFLCIFLGVVTIAFSYTCASLFPTEILNHLTCASLFPTQIWNCLTRPCCEQRQEEVQRVEMGAQPRLSVVDTPPSYACVILGTTSSGANEPEGPAVLSPAWDDAPVPVHCATTGLPGDEAIVVSPAGLLNTRVSSPALEAALEIEGLSVSRQ